MKYLIAFDISNTRRRKNVTKACQAVGFRVQRSVFEAFLEPNRLSEFEHSMKQKIDAAKDSVRIYPLDKTADSLIRIVGAGKSIDSPDFAII